MPNGVEYWVFALISSFGRSRRQDQGAGNALFAAVTVDGKVWGRGFVGVGQAVILALVRGGNGVLICSVYAIDTRALFVGQKTSGARALLRTLLGAVLGSGIIGVTRTSDCGCAALTWGSILTAGTLLTGHTSLVSRSLGSGRAILVSSALLAGTARVVSLTLLPA